MSLLREERARTPCEMLRNFLRFQRLKSLNAGRQQRMHPGGHSGREVQAEETVRAEAWRGGNRSTVCSGKMRLTAVVGEVK